MSKIPQKALNKGEKAASKVVVSEAVSFQGKTAGIATILALGLTNGTAMAASTADVAAGATVTDEILFTGDTQRVHGVANYTYLYQGAVQYVSEGGVTNNTKLNNWGGGRVDTGG